MRIGTMPSMTPARVGEMYNIMQVAITAVALDRKNLSRR